MFNEFVGVEDEQAGLANEPIAEEVCFLLSGLPGTARGSTLLGDPSLQKDVLGVGVEVGLQFDSAASTANGEVNGTPVGVPAGLPVVSFNPARVADQKSMLGFETAFELRVAVV